MFQTTPSERNFRGRTRFNRLLSGLVLLPVCGLLHAQSVPRELTLQQAIDIALERHAEIEAADASIEARAGARRQAGYSPNPTFFLQTENWRFTGTPGFSPSRDLDVFAFVSQTIETGGKKRRRVELARAEGQIAELEKGRIEWMIQKRVKQAYWRVLAALGRQRLLSENRRTFEQLVSYQQNRVQLGAAPEVDLIKTRLEKEKGDVALASARLARDRAKIELLRAMGIPEIATDFAVREESLEVTTWDTDAVLERLVSSALEHRFEVLLSQAYVQRAQHALELARAQGRPDVTPYLGYKRSGQFNTLIGGLSIPLPIFDRNAGRIDEAAAELQQSSADLRAVEARVRAEVAAAIAATAQHAEMLQSMQVGMLDRAVETSQIALAAYQEGGTDLLNLLDAQRSENEVRLLYSDLLFDYAQSRVELEAAVGADLDLKEQDRRVGRSIGGTAVVAELE